MAVKIKIKSVSDNIAQLNQLVVNVDIVDGATIINKDLFVDGADVKTAEDIEKILKDKLDNLKKAKDSMVKFNALVGKEIL